MNHLPEEMRALQIDHYHEDIFEAIRNLKVVHKPIAKLSPGQVLIKVEAAPCNPSDLLLLQGRYGIRKVLPFVPGWEGAGTVIATGGGLLGKWLMGKRVAFSNQNEWDGTWAQYSIANAMMCIVLKKDVSFTQGSAMIINPLTTLGLIDIAKREGHQAVIQTAAASQVGRMVLKLANRLGIPVIHIVRRKDQEVLLKELGAKIILNSEADSFEEDLKREAQKLKATMAFEAIAGSMTGIVLSAMPKHSKVLVYGALSASNCSQISPLGLIFQQKTVKGFYLSGWIAKKSFWGLYRTTNFVQKLIVEGTFQTAISAHVKLEDASKALESYQMEMTQGKILIKPQAL